MATTVETEWSEEQARQEIAEGKYDDYIWRCVKRVLPRLPKYGLSLQDQQEDLFADLRLCALEAAKRFDAGKGVGFFTFLYRHLEICSLREVKFRWSSRRCPAPQKVTHFSRLCRSDGGRPKSAGRSLEDALGEQHLLVRKTTAPDRCWADEILCRLSPQARRTLENFVRLPRRSLLLYQVRRMIRTQYYRRVAKTITSEQLRDFCREVGALVDG